MAAETIQEFQENAQIRLKRREKRLVRRQAAISPSPPTKSSAGSDDSGEESAEDEDESSSTALAASLSSPIPPSTSRKAEIDRPATQSASATSSSPSRSGSSAPNALPELASTSSSSIITAIITSTTRKPLDSITTTSITRSSNASTSLPTATAAPLNTGKIESSAGTEQRLAIGAVVTSGLFIILGLLACLFLRRRNKRRRSRRLESQSNMSQWDEKDEPLFLIRGAIGPTSFWRPWSAARSKSRIGRPETYLQGDDQSLYANNRPRPRSDLTQSVHSTRSSRGWYLFSGSERIVSALSISNWRQKIAGSSRPDIRGDEKHSWSIQDVPAMPQRPDSGYFASRLNARTLVGQSPLAHCEAAMQSRFSVSDESTVTRPAHTLSRTSSALEREYLPLPATAVAQHTRAMSSHDGPLDDHNLRSSRLQKVHRSLASWLIDQRRSHQNMSPLP